MLYEWISSFKKIMFPHPKKEENYEAVRFTEGGQAYLNENNSPVLFTYIRGKNNRKVGILTMFIRHNVLLAGISRLNYKAGDKNDWRVGVELAVKNELDVDYYSKVYKDKHIKDFLKNSIGKLDRWAAK